uniref:NB-ARC domain-containing protein n=1 Tax=Solanum lycopersicum TaxID=4081 RepID=A0A3Q7H8A4_SOLLC
MDLLKTIIKSIQGCAEETLDLLEKMEETDKEAWECLKRTFMDRNNGSRVIITTRNQDVTERADNRGFVHKLRFLSQEESCDLFCWKLVDVQAMVQAMESLAKDIGLPLAIVVLSGLLPHRWGLDKWQNVKDCLWKDIEEDSIEISYILSLSYNDFSAALK